MANLIVGLDIPIPPSRSGGSAGGVEQFCIGLISGLSAAASEDVEFVLFTHPGDPDWLAPYTGEQMRIVPLPWGSNLQRVWAALGPAQRVLRPLVDPIRDRFSGAGTVSVDDTDGFYEAHGVDIVHFTTQRFRRTSLPTIYNPHDLQHRHYPEFYSEERLAYRETMYSAGITEADAVAVNSNWVRGDVTDQYGVPSEKVFAIPVASPVTAYTEPSGSDLEHIRSRLTVSRPFCLYPAQTWPHKNHAGLFDAMAHLRDEDDLKISAVLTGKETDHWTDLSEQIERLDLADQVQHMGFVSPRNLRALYREATATVVPTLFEAASFPMFEAWEEGCAVACSNVTSLPEIAGDAAVVFDPDDTQAFASALERVLTDEALRDDLVRKGRERIEQFQWRKTGGAYIDLYRTVAEGRTQEADLDREYAEVFCVSA